MGVGWAFNRATTYSVAYQVSRHYLNQLWPELSRAQSQVYDYWKPDRLSYLRADLNGLIINKIQ